METTKIKNVSKHGRQWRAKIMVAGKKYGTLLPTQAEAEAWIKTLKHRLELGLPVDEVKVPRTHRLNTIEDVIQYTDKMEWSKRKSGKKLKTTAECFSRWVGPSRLIKEAFNEASTRDCKEACEEA